MNHNLLRAWIILTSTRNLGPRKILDLLHKWPTAEAILQNITDLPLSTAIKQQLRHPNEHYIEQALNWQNQRQHHHLVPLDSKLYPPLLRTITDPPLLLYCIGNLNHLHLPQIAIVGSRRASPYGMQQARAFAAQLAHNGFCITSGLALGIDGSAHQGALAASGNTIAVLGSGVNRVYPRQHHQLAHQIGQHNLLISEAALDCPPHAFNFPRRNRIISGLSLGTLVIEATANSGSLITANLANEQGREVFAIPGAISHPQSAGAHYLIKQGAKLVTDINDILEEFAWPNQAPALQNEQIYNQKLDPTLCDLLECVDYTITKLEDIHKISQLPLKVMTPRLLNLELMGYIKRTIGGYIRVN